MASTRAANKTGAASVAVRDSGVQYSTDELRAIARELRRDIVKLTFTAGADIQAAPSQRSTFLPPCISGSCGMTRKTLPGPTGTDLCSAKATPAPACIRCWPGAAYFPHEELWTFRKINSRIQGHAHTDTPGVEMNSGSLGQGLSFAVGTALAANIDKKDYRMYVMLGDGECDEGQVWEAAMAASHYKLGNLTAFVDRNRIQNDRFTSEVMELEPLAAKWRAFGWRVLEIDGHDFGQILDSIVKAQRTRGRPTVIIARTVKGKGVSFMENNPDFHGRAPNQEEYDQAMRELA